MKIDIGFTKVCRRVRVEFKMNRRNEHLSLIITTRASARGYVLVRNTQPGIPSEGNAQPADRPG
jgi:hypothetical protein